MAVSSRVVAAAATSLRTMQATSTSLIDPTRADYGLPSAPATEISNRTADSA
jgi:hypothetical protein